VKLALNPLHRGKEEVLLVREWFELKARAGGRVVPEDVFVAKDCAHAVDALQVRREEISLVVGEAEYRLLPEFVDHVMRSSELVRRKYALSLGLEREEGGRHFTIPASSLPQLLRKVNSEAPSDMPVFRDDGSLGAAGEVLFSSMVAPWAQARVLRGVSSARVAVLALQSTDHRVALARAAAASQVDLRLGLGCHVRRRGVWLPQQCAPTAELLRELRAQGVWADYARTYVGREGFAGLVRLRAVSAESASEEAIPRVGTWLCLVLVNAVSVAADVYVSVGLGREAEAARARGSDADADADRVAQAVFLTTVASLGVTALANVVVTVAFWRKLRDEAREAGLADLVWRLERSPVGVATALSMLVTPEAGCLLLGAATPVDSATWVRQYAWSTILLEDVPQLVLQMLLVVLASPALLSSLLFSAATSVLVIGLRGGRALFLAAAKRGRIKSAAVGVAGSFFPALDLDDENDHSSAATMALCALHALLTAVATLAFLAYNLGHLLLRPALHNALAVGLVLGAVALRALAVFRGVRAIADVSAGAARIDNLLVAGADVAGVLAFFGVVGNPITPLAVMHVSWPRDALAQAPLWLAESTLQIAAAAIALALGPHTLPNLLTSVAAILSVSLTTPVLLVALSCVTYPIYGAFFVKDMAEVESDSETCCELCVDCGFTFCWRCVLAPCWWPVALDHIFHDT
jgi:hypothetical protein